MKLYRPATVLVGILFVLLGGLTRLAGPDQVFEEDNRVVKRGTIGQAVPYGDSTVTVHRMKFARAYLTGETGKKAVETSGIYVALEYGTVQGTQDISSPNGQLTTDKGTVYLPIAETYGSDIDFPAPGFGVIGSIIFEVNPADLKGLTLKVSNLQLFNVMGQDVAIDLGVPDEKIAQQQIDAATPEYLIAKSITRVAS
ncbi:hypothetical protein [Kribbella catacumbae]|uniref:hypothetical protein n=1 Tax=Kribbella catacumbae TaxID=460086 RepID=UPI00035EA960|nr:hypothetical protein [Kribbella catacumbae]